MEPSSTQVQLPVVLVDVMRAGPGLGNIGPEQGDYNQVVKGGGHGNYRCIVLAPNSVQEMCDFTMKAFELAFKWRTPVFVLADGTLGQMMESLKLPEKAIEPKVDASWAVAGTAETRQNLVTSIFLDFDQLGKFNDFLQEKYAKIRESEARWEDYQTDDAETVLVAYGISSRIARSAVDTARQGGKKVGLLRPKTLFPFPEKRLKELVANGTKRFVSVEMSNGQMRDDIRLAVDCAVPVDLVSRLGGNLLDLNQILSVL